MKSTYKAWFTSTITLFTLPKSDETTICQEKYDYGTIGVDPKSSSNDSNHHNSKRKRNESHTSGHTVGMIGKSLKKKKSYLITKLKQENHKEIEQ